jgi:hypothetical protein
MASGAHSTESGSDAAFLKRLRDGWGLVRGTVRLSSGELVDYCGVVYYPATPLADSVPQIGRRTNTDGVYRYPLPAGMYTMAANGVISRVGADGGTVGVPLIGKVTEVVVSPRQIVTADIIVTERTDLIGKTGNLADLLDVRDHRSR